MSAYATVKQAYTEATVMTASPERLVVMLYDGAIRFLHQSAVAMRSDQLELSRARLSRAEAIIDELNVALDMNCGEVAESLRSIYNFCKRHLIDANLRRDADSIDQVRDLLKDLRGAWGEVAAEPAQAVASVQATA
jgi:flagellar protein FliS